jgi:hypothetical protein
VFFLYRNRRAERLSLSFLTTRRSAGAISAAPDSGLRRRPPD